jgi:hypothetical protein
MAPDLCGLTTKKEADKTKGEMDREFAAGALAAAAAA